MDKKNYVTTGINDPGTAISILNSYVKLFHLWFSKTDKAPSSEIKYDRVEVPAIETSDLFNDAFRPIARDGANNIEVMIRMQKALTSIYTAVPNKDKQVVINSSQEAYERAEMALEYKGDLEQLKDVSLHFNVGALPNQ